MEPAVLDQLTAALDALAGVDLDSLTEGELDDEVVALLTARSRVDAELTRRVARWDARAVWIGDGSRSAAARLGRDGKLSPPAAAAVVRRARGLASMPIAADAWAAGLIGAEQIDLLGRAAGAGRDELFTRDEPMLLGFCEDLSHTQATKAMRYWMGRADAELGRDGPEPTATSLRISTTFDGTVVGDFTLDPIGGATVAKALQLIERELELADRKAGVTRTKAERVAAALVEMAVRAHTPKRKGHRPDPLVMIVAGEASIEHILELSTGTVIDAKDVIPYLAMSQVQTFIFDGADRVVAASKQRTFRGRLRRAIQVRDRHCQHPAGCDEPIDRCDVNHTTPHRHGGITEERGGDLECWPHNRKSDLHDRVPASVIEAARRRREDEAFIRQRVQALTADQANRPPPAAA